jgi:RHS repeat-associated protein
LADVIPGPGGTEVVHHVHLDHLGSPRIATAENRVPIQSERRKYRPFGLSLDANPQTGRLQFTGHERDDDGSLSTWGDLDHMHARVYGPTLRLFLSIDPVLGSPAAPQSWNRYSYVLNNRMTKVDPDGKYARDFDYEVTLMMGVAAGLDLGTANKVAIATQRVDEDARNPFRGFARQVTSHMLDQPNRVWHFADSEMMGIHGDIAFNGGDENDLGDYLHPFQDTFSHSDYMGLGFHRTTGPNKTQSHPLKAFRAAKETYELIAAWGAINGKDLAKQVPFEFISSQVYYLMITRADSGQRTDAVTDLWDTIDFWTP